MFLYFATVPASAAAIAEPPTKVAAANANTVIALKNILNFIFGHLV